MGLLASFPTVGDTQVMWAQPKDGGIYLHELNQDPQYLGHGGLIVFAREVLLPVSS